MAENNIDWRSKDVAVMSKDGIFIDNCKPNAVPYLLKKKIASIINTNPFTLKMNCDYINQIQDAYEYLDFKAQRSKEVEKKCYANKLEKIKKNKENDELVGKKKSEAIDIKRIKRRNSIDWYESIIKNYKKGISKKTIEKNKERSIRRKFAGKISKKDLLNILKSQGCKCYYCTEDITDNYQMEHYIPINLGGLTDKENIVASCKRCNLLKKSKPPKKFYEYVLKYGIDGYVYENSLFFLNINTKKCE